ncbi:SAM-dependent MidA family methyltransferase [Amaricoccus macauensis]|uniref:SAM-dependent MidA family methyltransferase n=1 Tax=Amaricoccus macauensis TaxID=57001 RepID=A0A840SL28_9RHOB|nr:SAM-dependent MidA family methyltransferase [Amaricoccus macauensis]
MSLAAALRARIAAEGSIRLDVWMGACLSAYYGSRDPLGAGGDFTTAPEISQMFGEMVGGWLAHAWIAAGRPNPVVLAELGPGRGTLMADILRLATRVPGFAEAASVWLVETSPALRARQAETLAAHRPFWAAHIDELPDAPLLLVANEFLDALPIRQFQRADVLWRERYVGLEGDRLAFVWGPGRADADLDARFPHALDGAIVEVSPVGEAIAARIGARIAAAGGAALLIDYGAWDGVGDTLQALRGHAPSDPLADPGNADLTAHVNFRAIAAAARPAVAFGDVGQGAFLESLGITERARALAGGHSPGDVEAIAAAHRRLTHPEEMGQLFRVVCLVPETDSTPPGFAA